MTPDSSSDLSLVNMHDKYGKMKEQKEIQNGTQTAFGSDPRHQYLKLYNISMEKRPKQRNYQKNTNPGKWYSKKKHLKDSHSPDHGIMQ